MRARAFTEYMLRAIGTPVVNGFLVSDKEAVPNIDEAMKAHRTREVQWTSKYDQARRGVLLVILSAIELQNPMTRGAHESLVVCARVADAARRRRAAQAA